MKSDPEKLKCCYIGGGSRNWAWVFIKDLAFETEMAGTIHLYDTDADAARANETIGNRVMDARNRGRWRFIAEDSPQKALEGSDFVFISILPGDFGEMAVDVHVPERYGIYQSVGDTTGPGGINRALRTVPQYQKIAGIIKQWAPDAWVINYTNPMSVCVRTLYETFPGIKAFGCCHEVFGTQNLLGKVLEWAGKADKGEVKRDDIIINVLGVNHFTWIDRASWKHIDLFPLYRRFVDTFAESGYSEDGEKHWLNSSFKCAHRVKMDLFRHFGVIAAAGDRHLAEFCPPAWYLKDPETVRLWCFGLTPVSWRIDSREKLKKKSAEYRNGTEELVPERSDEEGLRQMRALLGLGNLTTNVNLPNRGQMPGFPEGAVVETNAVFSRDSVRPVIAGRLPYPLEPLVLGHVKNQEGIVRAAVERDLDKAFMVFLNDPAVCGLNREDARALFGEMTAATLPSAFAYSFKQGE